MFFEFKIHPNFLTGALMIWASLFPTLLGAADIPPAREGNRSEPANGPTSPTGISETGRGTSIIRLVNDSDVTLELRAANASSWADNPIRETGLIVTPPKLLEPGSNKLLEATGLGSTIEAYLWLCESVANYNDDPASIKLRIKFDRPAQTHTIINKKVDGYITAASKSEKVGNLEVVRITIASGDWIYIR